MYDLKSIRSKYESNIVRNLIPIDDPSGIFIVPACSHGSNARTEHFGAEREREEKRKKERERSFAGVNFRSIERIDVRANLSVELAR